MSERNLGPWVPRPCFQDWSCKGAINRPSSRYSPPNCSLLNMNLLRPFSDCFSLTTERQAVVVRAVSVLFPSGDPSAIVGRIASIIISPVNGVFLGWSLPHIGKKVLKFFPSFANRDSPSAVILPRSLPWVCASRPHGAPYAILIRLSHAVKVRIPTSAPTALFTRQCDSRYQPLSSARTSAVIKILSITRILDSFSGKTNDMYQSKF